MVVVILVVMVMMMMITLFFFKVRVDFVTTATFLIGHQTSFQKEGELRHTTLSIISRN